MALNIKPPIGVNYGSHLSKPITGLSTTTKSVAGKPVLEGLSASETLHPGVFTNGMSITVAGGRTLNLGNFESARVDVSITVPCDPASLNESYAFGTAWVSERIEEAVKLAKSEY